MSYRSSIYFRAKDTVMQVEFDSEQPIDENVLYRQVNKKALLEFVGLDEAGMTEADIELLSPEAFRAEYGEETKGTERRHGAVHKNTKETR